MRFLLGLGLADEQSIDVRTHLTFRDVLVRRMQKRLAGEHEDVVLLRVSVHGTVGGVERTLTYEMVELYDRVSTLTAMKRCTSIPASVIAIQLASGRIEGGGATPPEMIVPKLPFLEEVRSFGLSISETWHDGHMPVTQAAAAE